MKKWLYAFLILFIILTTGFSMPGPRVDIYIENHSQQSIIIEYKLEHGDSNPETNYFFQQKIVQMNLTIHDSMFNKSLKVRPNKRLSMIEYYFPGGEINQLRAISFMDFIKSTFKEFKIFTENGSRVITLDTLEKEKVRINDYKNGTSYILEIYEQDDSKE
mgnify:CR=1 FL=1